MCTLNSKTEGFSHKLQGFQPCRDLMYLWQSVIIHYFGIIFKCAVDSDLNLSLQGQNTGQWTGQIFTTTAKLPYVPAKHDQSVPDLIRDAPVRFR